MMNFAFMARTLLCESFGQQAKRSFVPSVGSGFPATRCGKDK